MKKHKLGSKENPFKPDWKLAPTPAAKFRTRLASRGKRFWDVKVFDTRKDMYDYQEFMGSRLKRDYDAITISLTRISAPPKGSKRKGKEDKEYQGEMLFHRASVTPLVIAHESTHAALFSAGNAGHKAVSTDNEKNHEAFCDAVGNLVEGIVKGLEKMALRDEALEESLRYDEIDRQLDDIVGMESLE